MYTINLTQDQRKNLIAFLERSTMTGAEVTAYLELVNILNEAYEIAEKNEETKKNVV